MVKYICNYIQYIFSSFCVFATVACTCYCFYQYVLDEDVSRIKFIEFHADQRSLYPSFSFCVNHRWTLLEKELKRHNVTTFEYYKYLNGKATSKISAKINYTQVKINIKEFLILIAAKTNNFQYRLYDPFSNGNWNPAQYETRIGYLSLIYDCLSFNVPFERGETIREFSVLLNTSVFPGGERAKGNWDFCILYHYPHQSLRSTLKKCNWKPFDKNYENHMSLYRIQKVEILRERNKRSKKCIENWNNDDEYILSRISKEVGCTPIHWALSSSLPTCTNLETLKNLSTKKPRYYTTYPEPPCQRVSHIFGEHEEYNVLSDNTMSLGKNISGAYEMQMRFEEEGYMLMEQTRSYDIQSLVGNSGGYLGLFLGYAVLQIPQGVNCLIHRMRRLQSLPKYHN